MAGTDIISLYVNTANFEKEYDWYRIDDRGVVLTLPDEPEVYEPLRERSLTRNRSLVLFQREGGSAGVFWGRDAVATPQGARGDWQGRSFGYTALVEFAEQRDAMEFYGGLLRHWWRRGPSGGPALPEFASRVGAVVEKQQLSPDEGLYAPLRELLEGWRGEWVESYGDGALLRECPLMAAEDAGDDERLRELDAYVRHDLPRSAVARRPPAEGVRPLVVVASTLVPDLLRGVWRALTDTADETLAESDGWKATGRDIAPALAPAPAPERAAATRREEVRPEEEVRREEVLPREEEVPREEEEEVISREEVSREEETPHEQEVAREQRAAVPPAPEPARASRLRLLLWALLFGGLLALALLLLWLLGRA